MRVNPRSPSIDSIHHADETENEEEELPNLDKPKIGNNDDEDDDEDAEEDDEDDDDDDDDEDDERGTNSLSDVF